jgi:ArsR family transcriptional regulator, arsenate/arsenite/antimonite-responsive transcriptional repressor
MIRPSAQRGPTNPPPVPAPGPRHEDDDARLAALAKALGHPARVRIVRYLAGSDACMCGQICDVVPLAPSTVSQHLKVLKQAGLITGEIDGTRVCYSLDRAVLAELPELVAALLPPPHDVAVRHA